MQRRNIVILGIAVMMGLAAVWLANSFFGAVADQAKTRKGPAPQVVQILAAKQDIAFGEVINAETAQLVDWPASSLPQGAIKANEAQAFLAKNFQTVRPLMAGEPILLSRSSDRAMLSATLPADQRAVSIPIDFVTGVSGFAKPGDIVDVVLTRAVPGSNATADDQMASVLLQNVAVLAIDASTTDVSTDPDAEPVQPGKVPKYTSATLMVDAIGAQKLALASQLGKLTLVLRNANDRTPAALAVVMPGDLGGGAKRVAPVSAAPTGPRRPAPARRAEPSQVIAPPPPYRPTMTVLRGTQESVEGIMTNGY